MFSKKATKFDKIFTVDLTLCSKCQIDGKDFVKFLGLPRKLVGIPRRNDFNVLKIFNRAILDPPKMF